MQINKLLMPQIRIFAISRLVFTPLDILPLLDNLSKRDLSIRGEFAD